MLTISKPLSAGQAQAYHAKEFTNPEQGYYSQQGQIHGEWHGRLAAEWGLKGEVSEEQFQRLANGQHPESGEQVVRHRQSFEYQNENDERVKTMEHRAGWDATFSAPKSVSLTALVGGDEQVREAHRESVRVALDELERFVQARMGGNNPAETTGKWRMLLSFIMRWAAAIEASAVMVIGFGDIWSFTNIYPPELVCVKEAHAKAGKGRCPLHGAA